jgi:hypothetical protein
MSARYSNYTLFINNTKHYLPLRAKRGLKTITHYGTPRLRNPNPTERSRLATDAYIWKYGDRFYQLAQSYYNDVRYWWIIAWYNGYPTEADVFPGDVLYIPIDIQEALQVLGVT